MPSVGPDEDVKLLLTIIKLAGVGTPDWQRVSDELGLKSKGAASKRFSRLPEKYGIGAPKTEGTPEATPNSTPKKAKASPKKTPGSAAKKRKMVEVEEVEDEGEGEEIKAEAED